MRYGHLERKKLILRTLSPIYIGSGQTLNKKEYIFDKEKETIHFVDLPALFSYLKRKNLLREYENFLLNRHRNDLLAFLQENNVEKEAFKSFIRYSIDGGEVAKEEKFKGVMTFIKDQEGRPYIPGSGIKGAIRTALAAYLLKKENLSYNKEEIGKAQIHRNPRAFLREKAGNLERKIFYKLDYKNQENGEDKFNAINDFMRGIRISDSPPIDFQHLTLVGKYDRLPDGTVNKLSIYRECVAPGCEIEISMILEIPMLKAASIDGEIIEKALHSFADSHYENFEQYFKELNDDEDISTMAGVDFILGGGVGYPSKTIIYNLYEREKALAIVSNYMMSSFQRNHNHHKDFSEYKVSPHTLKTAIYKGKYHQMGRCQLIIE